MVIIGKWQTVVQRVYAVYGPCEERRISLNQRGDGRKIINIRVFYWNKPTDIGVGVTMSEFERIHQFINNMITFEKDGFFKAGKGMCTNDLIVGLRRHELCIIKFKSLGIFKSICISIDEYQNFFEQINMLWSIL